MPKADKFAVGDLVFAKVKGYPPWPARITGLGSKEKYKIYFYGTYETASLKSEDIWMYNTETEARFGPKYIKKKGYREGLYQIAHTPEICPIVDSGGKVSKLDSSQDVSVSLDDSFKKLPSPTKVSSVGKVEKKSVSALELPKFSSQQPERSALKRKAFESGVDNDAGLFMPAAKQPKLQDLSFKQSRSLRPDSVELSGDEASKELSLQQPARSVTEVGAGGDVNSNLSNLSPQKEPVVDLGEGRRLWVKVKDTDDLIEINLDKDRPDSFQSEQARVEWEAASARKALKFKKRIESGEFIPPEILKRLEDKAKRSPAEQEAGIRDRKLEKSKEKLRWLRIEQRLVELYIAVKTSLNLERPSPDRCIVALDELCDLNLLPLMLKKQPDIVTTIRKLRNYVGPKDFRIWMEEDARNRMERSVGIIQSKAEEIFHKFRKCFSLPGQEEERFYENFLKEVEEFKSFTKSWGERKVLSMVRDPTRPISALNPVSDDED